MCQSDLQIVRDHICEIMPKIERLPAGKILFPWLSVTYGKHYGSTIFTWDHHHAAMRFAIAGKPEYLRFLIDNLLTYQQDDGNTPSIIHINKGPRFLDMPFHAQPFMFQGAFLYVHQTGDTTWAETVFDKLVKYLAYYEDNYSAAFDLKRWRTGWAGGMDNDVVTAFFPPDTIASSDINGWFYLELLAAEKLAQRLERSEAAEAFLRQSERHRRVVNDMLWCDQMQSYSAYHLCDGRRLFHVPYEKVPPDVGRFAFQSCSNLIPLYARMADRESGRSMIQRYVIQESHFWSPHGIRTLSKFSEYFNNARWGNPSRFGDHRRITESNWQGPVWICINYFTFHALRYYGFTEEAQVLADRTLGVLARSLDVQGSFSENCHSETGDPLYATHFASWNLLGNAMHDELQAGAWIMDSIFQNN